MSINTQMISSPKSCFSSTFTFTFGNHEHVPKTVKVVLKLNLRYTKGNSKTFKLFSTSFLTKYKTTKQIKHDERKQSFHVPEPDSS